MSLYIKRKKNTKILLGDHSIITIADIDKRSNEVEFILETKQKARRVDTPEMVMEEGRVRARIQLGRTDSEMVKVPVFVAVGDSAEVPRIKASLTEATAYFPGSTVKRLGEGTNIGPAHHQFLVVRCTEKNEAHALRRVSEYISVNYLDSIEKSDASVYMLFVTTTPVKKEKDVIYIDLVDRRKKSA